MDPIALIVTALAAGAASGVTTTASSAIKDAYEGLRALVAKRLQGRSGAELVLAKHESAPETWQAPLTVELDEAGAATDPPLLAAAQALLKLMDPTGAGMGKYQIDVRGAQGVQVGEHNRQDNVFYVPPDGKGDR